MEIESQGSTTLMRRYVAGVLVQEIQGSSVQERYLYHDHVGSVSRVTNTSGAVVEGTDFGAFGERRGFANPTLNPQPLTTTPRGYTGHEHVETFGIVHMNGRIYEPRLGRFLQADPFVQEPGNLQNYNRYTYVWNNPLNATDPSGYLGVKERQWAAVVIAVVGLYFGQTWQLEGAAAMWWGAGVGAASGGVATQSTSGALWGAFSGFMFYGAGQWADGFHLAEGSLGRAAAHAVAGGVVAGLQGGNAGHGFVSAGLSKFAMANLVTSNDVWGGTKAAMIGGSISALTGGKFANGAATAAMQFGMNQAMRRSEPREGSRAYAEREARQRSINSQRNHVIRQNPDGSWSSWPEEFEHARQRGPEHLDHMREFRPAGLYCHVACGAGSAVGTVLFGVPSNPYYGGADGALTVGGKAAEIYGAVDDAGGSRAGRVLLHLRVAMFAIGSVVNHSACRASYCGRTAVERIMEPKSP